MIQQNLYETVFRINQRIDISLEKGQAAEYFSSRIEDFDHETMIIAMPMHKGMPILLQPGNAFFGKVIADTAVYQFSCTFKDKELSPLAIWRVSLPRDIRKIQQRSFVRVECMLPLTIEPLIPESVPFTELDVLSKDISGGGLQFATKQLLEIGTKLKMRIQLPEAGIISVSGEIVRVEKPPSDYPVYWMGFKFLEVPEKERAKIIRYVFQRQLELRKKGL